MKNAIRILVLLVAVLLIFIAGFWLGSRGKPSSSGDPVASLSDKVSAQKEALAPKGEEKKTEGDSVVKEETKPGAAADAPPAGEKPPESADPEPPKPAGEAAPATEGKVAEAKPPAEETAHAKPEPAAKDATPSPDAPAGDDKKPSVPKDGPAPGPRGMTLAEAAPGAPSDKPAEGEPPSRFTSEDLGANHLTYSIQAGAFLDRALAEERLETLQSRMYPAYLVSAWDDKKQLWHTVRVGRYTDILQARVAARQLSRKERIAAYVYGIGSLRFDEIQDETPTAPAPAAPAKGNQQAALKETP